MSTVLAKLRIDTRYAPGFLKPAFQFRVKPNEDAVRLRGTQPAAVQHALALSRREGRAWAVLQAGRGVFELRPLWVNRSSDDPSIQGLKELRRIPGHQKLWLERSTPNLLAVTDATAYVFGTRQRILVAQG